MDDQFSRLTQSDWFSPLREYSMELIDTFFTPITTVRAFTENGKRIVEAKGIQLKLHKVVWILTFSKVRGPNMKMLKPKNYGE